MASATGTRWVSVLVIQPSITWRLVRGPALAEALSICARAGLLNANRIRDANSEFMALMSAPFELVFEQPQVWVGSSFDPGGKFCRDELLYAFSTAQPPPEFAAFTFKADADVKEWTAGTLQRSELGQGLVIRWVGRKFELVTIWQFLDAQDRFVENLAEFLLALSLIWS